MPDQRTAHSLFFQRSPTESPDQIYASNRSCSRHSPPPPSSERRHLHLGLIPAGVPFWCFQSQPKTKPIFRGVSFGVWVSFFRGCMLESVALDIRYPRFEPSMGYTETGFWGRSREVLISGCGGGGSGGVGGGGGARTGTHAPGVSLAGVVLCYEGPKNSQCCADCSL